MTRDVIIEAGLPEAGCTDEFKDQLVALLHNAGGWLRWRTDVEHVEHLDPLADRFRAACRRAHGLVHAASLPYPDGQWAGALAAWDHALGLAIAEAQPAPVPLPPRDEAIAPLAEALAMSTRNALEFQPKVLAGVAYDRLAAMMEDAARGRR
jgi:hypothetical protein